MSAAAHDFALPDGTGLTDDELAVGIADDGNATGFVNYYFSRRIDLRPGEYSVKFWAMHSAVLFVGTNEITGRRVIGATSDGGMQEGGFFVFDGETRLSVILAHLDAGSTLCGFAFSLWRDGRLIYKSDETAWLFDTVPIPDSEITESVDARLSLPVFTIRPNWKDGITERLMWLTDIAVSEVGEEQRRAVRVYPRRSFEAGFMRHDVRRSRLDNFLLGIGRKQFLLPLWHEQFKPVGGVAASTGGTFIDAATVTNREFHAGDLVLIDGGDPNNYEVAAINALDLETGEITWASAPREWRAGSRITPLRVARVIDDAQLSNLTDQVAQAQLRFELDDPDDQFGPDGLSQPSWDYGVPYFQYQPNRADAIAVSYPHLDFTQDNQVGVPVRTDPSDQGWPGQRFSLLLRGRYSVFQFRRFLAMARGRALRFYMPSFTHDVQPIGAITGMYLDAKPAGLEAFTQNGQNARHVLAIKFRDNTPTLFREVTNVEAQLDGFGIVEYERISVNLALPDVDLSRVKRIEWVTTSRFDQDGFELHHHVDNCAAVSVALVTRLVDDTDMETIAT